MNEVEISVIVPVYNVEKYLQECVDSILGQTFRNFELILVEDCSTDNSKALCREIRDNNPNVKLLCNIENMGLSITRNNGLTVAKGKYIAFIDSDDWVEKNYLASMYNIAEANNADVVCMGYTDYVSDDNVNYKFGNIMKLVNQPVLLTTDKKLGLRLLNSPYPLNLEGMGLLLRENPA